MFFPRVNSLPVEILFKISPIRSSQLQPSVHFCSYFQNTLGNTTGYTYQSIVVTNTELVLALQSKAIDFIYSTSATIVCAVAEIPGTTVTANVGGTANVQKLWHESGTIVALASSNITTV